jgi:hypothetical protein
MSSSIRRHHPSAPEIAGDPYISTVKATRRNMLGYDRHYVCVPMSDGMQQILDPTRDGAEIRKIVAGYAKTKGLDRKWIRAKQEELGVQKSKVSARTSPRRLG